jgi:hypothetical protein
MSAALVVVGVFLVVILVIAVRRSRVRRRDETPEDWLIRAKRDQEKSRKWLAGGYGAAVGIWAAGSPTAGEAAAEAAEATAGEAAAAEAAAAEAAAAEAAAADDRAVGRVVMHSSLRLVGCTRVAQRPR